MIRQGGAEMRRRAILLGLLLFLTPAAPALGDTKVNACGRYSIWVPDSWEITLKSERMTAESRDNGLYLVVAPIEDKSADVIDDDVVDFIDDELENMKITSDRREKLGVSRPVSWREPARMKPMCPCGQSRSIPARMKD
jgi:hypothetical protein